jgi:hypothetical protein
MSNDYYREETSPLAVISLITGIGSYFFLPFFGGIAAIITGLMAKKQIRESGGKLSGLGMANAGQILGWVQIGLILLTACVVVVLLATGVFGSIWLFTSPAFQ